MITLQFDDARTGHLRGCLEECLAIAEEYRHVIGDEDSILDEMTRIVFYTHLKMPRTTRAAEAEALLLDPEQQQRMYFLHRHDPEGLRMVANTDVFEYVNNGVSPRGIMSLVRTAATYAFVKGTGERLKMTHAHIRAIAPDVLAHRVRLNSQARVRDISPGTLLNVVMDTVLGEEANHVETIY